MDDEVFEDDIDEVFLFHFTGTPTIATTREEIDFLCDNGFHLANVRESKSILNGEHENLYTH